MAQTIRMRPSRRPPPPKPPRSPRKAIPLLNGRAWINGFEVGGADPRYAHLNRSYD